jgi:hypothetical protein
MVVDFILATVIDFRTFEFFSSLASTSKKTPRSFSMAEPIRTRMHTIRLPLGLMLILVLSLADSTGAAEKAKVVFISGSPSHGQMHHEHRAGNMILAQALNRSGLEVEAVLVPHYGYPREKAILQDAATVVIFCTGHSGHVVKPHLDEFDALMKKGAGVVMIHRGREGQAGREVPRVDGWVL